MPPVHVPGRIALYGIFRPLRHSPLEQQPPKRTVSQCRVLQILVITAHFFFIGAATVFFFSVYVHRRHSSNSVLRQFSTMPLLMKSVSASACQPEMHTLKSLRAMPLPSTPTSPSSPTSVATWTPARLYQTTSHRKAQRSP